MITKTVAQDTAVCFPSFCNLPCVKSIYNLNLTITEQTQEGIVQWSPAGTIQDGIGGTPTFLILTINFLFCDIRV
jgi:hypothetical protein